MKTSTSTSRQLSTRSWRITRTCGKSKLLVEFCEVLDAYEQILLFRSSHLWVNIHAGYYDFLQEETDAEIIRNLTKASVVDFFNLHFFNSPTHTIRRITSHQQSQCLEPASLLLLAPLLGTVKLPVDQTALQQFASTNPTLAGLKSWSNTYLLEAGNSQKTVDAYLKKVDELLGGEYKVPEGFTLIENRNEFRSQRTPGPYAVPVAEVSFHLFRDLLGRSSFHSTRS